MGISVDSVKQLATCGQNELIPTKQWKILSPLNGGTVGFARPRA